MNRGANNFVGIAYFRASSTATATLTVIPTMGLLPVASFFLIEPTEVHFAGLSCRIEVYRRIMPLKSHRLPPYFSCIWWQKWWHKKLPIRCVERNKAAAYGEKKGETGDTGVLWHRPTQKKEVKKSRTVCISIYLSCC